MELQSIAARFVTDGSAQECRSFGSGHINATYMVRTDAGQKYILQKINRYVFRDPAAVMENVIRVTRFLSKKEPDPRRVLQFIPTHNGSYYHVDENGDYWRMYTFLEGFCLDQPRSLEDLYQSALTFGRFQQLLSDFPAQTLHETIPDFHNTPARFQQLRRAAEENKAGRLAAVQVVYDRLMRHEPLASQLQLQLENGTLPLRVTHNDTKLNNVLLDRHTGEGLCLLDLDTVMPGLSLHDFGDAVRFGAATAAEDTRETACMAIDLDAFRAYVRGFLEAAVNLTEQELALLPLSPIVMTLELAARFLADHLDGDLYFKVAYPEHNLVRACAQLKLAEDMLEKLPIMTRITEEERRK